MSSENKDDQNSTPPDVKDGDDSSKVEDPKNADESSKDSIKESEKSDSEEEEMGLLDRPVEITGSRERKKVQRLELSFATPSKEKHEIPEGTGQKLSECPRVEFQIQKNPFGELKALHKILFNRPGSGNEIKKNIRKFSGFTFPKGSQEFDKKKVVMEKFTTTVLKHVCEVLDLERGGAKEDIVVRILDFLLNPKASGKKVPALKKKLSNKGEKKKSQDKKSKGSGKKTKGKKDESTEESDSAAEDSVKASSSEVDQDSLSEEEPKKKKTKLAASKQKESLQKGKKNEKNSDKPKKEEKKSATKAAKRKRGEDSGESSDDEPLVKKNKMPSDEEIKKLVKEILDSADLQEITMKKVIKQVADTFPDFDLSGKKDFIKTTVKSVIS